MKYSIQLVNKIVNKIISHILKINKLTNLHLINSLYFMLLYYFLITERKIHLESTKNHKLMILKYYKY